MICIRSFLFSVFYVLWNASVSILGIPSFLGPRKASCLVARFWAAGVLVGLRLICNVRYEIRGNHNLTAQPVIYACKHQSAWDIYLLLSRLPHPVFVLKRELLRIPFVGWYMWRMGMIPIDRGSGAAALKKMLDAAKVALHDRRPLIVFPEGTRTAPGAHVTYHPGVAGMYSRLMVPVVPAALNSGCYWPRNAFLKRPGTVVIEFLPAIAPGLPARAFMQELERTIEGASARLLAEATASTGEG